MHTWASALANGALLSPRMLEQRLQTLGVPGAPPEETYGLGIFNLGGWIGQTGSVPGYQTVAVYLPEEQTTLVILTNTDIPYRGGDPSTPLASAITRVLSPDHVYTLGGAQGPDTPPSPAPTTKPR
jgi:D-alanyl-D-alanine carboxypeptidase